MGETVNLLDSLLDAIIRLEGEALVMHVGEKPYVVTTPSSLYAFRGPLAWGQVELSTRMLTSEAVLGMLGQILPLEQRQGLEEFGAVEYEIPRENPEGERFTVVAARGGDDVWLEVRRRHPQAEVEATGQPEAAPEEVPAIAVPDETPPAVIEAAVPAAVAQEQPQRVEQPQSLQYREERPLHYEEEQPAEQAVEPAQPIEDEESYALRPEEVAEPVEEVALITEEFEEAQAGIAEAEPQQEVFEISLEDAARPAELDEPIELVPDVEQALPTSEDVDELLAATAAGLREQAEEDQPRAEQPVAEEPAAAEEPGVTEPVAQEPAAEEPGVTQPVAEQPVVELRAEEQAEEPRSAVILPISRPAIRSEPAPSSAQAPAALIAPLEHMLRVAAARGASTVYVVAGSKPMIRVDGEISTLDAEAVFAASDVDRVVMELAPARGRDGNQPVEWMSDVPEVGRIRCLTFSDHRGPGIIFRMIPPRAISAEQLGLSDDVQALCAQPDGLVLVTGPRASGKSTLLSAFVDLINRTRSDHVITIESQIAFVHESRRSFVSQREVRGDSEAAVAALRSAFREDPDVLVIEDLRTPEIVMAALEAAESGRLVFGSLRASSTAAAIERLVELLPAERRAQAQSSLATSLRGVVSQLLLRKVKGGRIAAREVLLNTPAVEGLLAEGKLFQLPVALDSGRKQGMVPLNESLAALVRDGTVHVAEAYRKALDREGLLALFKRDGMDTSFAERLA